MQGASPDEVALVEGATALGFEMRKRPSPDTLLLSFANMQVCRPSRVSVSTGLADYAPLQQWKRLCKTPLCQWLRLAVPSCSS